LIILLICFFKNWKFSMILQGVIQTDSKFIPLGNKKKMF